MVKNDNPEPKQTVIALARGLEILQCFSASRPQMGSAEIARMTKLPQPTVWRLCQTLVEYGFLLPTPNGQRLQLGTSSLALGIAATASFNAMEIVRPRMQALADRYKAAVSIAGCERLQMVYLERCTAEVMIGTNFQRGSRMPLHKCTLGWAYLVALDTRARRILLDKLMEEYPQDKTSIEELAASKLKEYEEHGYVLQRGLVHRDIIALAIPIPAPAGRPPLTINCSTGVDNLTADQLKEEVMPQLREMVELLQALFVENPPVSAPSWFERQS